MIKADAYSFDIDGSAASLRDFFSLGSFGDRCELRAAIFDNAITAARKLMGDSARVCFVGDTPDVHAARSVNAQILAVSSSFLSSR